MKFDKLSKRETELIQAGSLAVGEVVSHTARKCGEIHSDGDGLNRAAGVRGGLTCMLPGFLCLSALVGMYDGKLMSDPKTQEPSHHSHGPAITFIAMLATKMIGDVANNHDNQTHTLTVELSPSVLVSAFDATEKVLGHSLDGWVDQELVDSVAEARKQIASGTETANNLLDMLVTGRKH